MYGSLKIHLYQTSNFSSGSEVQQLREFTIEHNNELNSFITNIPFQHQKYIYNNYQKGKVTLTINEITTSQIKGTVDFRWKYEYPTEGQSPNFTIDFLLASFGGYEQKIDFYLDANLGSNNLSGIPYTSGTLTINNFSSTLNTKKYYSPTSAFLQLSNLISSNSTNQNISFVMNPTGTVNNNIKIGSKTQGILGGLLATNKDNKLRIVIYPYKNNTTDRFIVGFDKEDGQIWINNSKFGSLASLDVPAFRLKGQLVIKQ